MNSKMEFFQSNPDFLFSPGNCLNTVETVDENRVNLRPDCNEMSIPHMRLKGMNTSFRKRSTVITVIP